MFTCVRAVTMNTVCTVPCTSSTTSKVHFGRWERPLQSSCLLVSLLTPAPTPPTVATSHQSSLITTVTCLAPGTLLALPDLTPTATVLGTTSTCPATYCPSLCSVYLVHTVRSTYCGYTSSCTTTWHVSMLSSQRRSLHPYLDNPHTPSKLSSCVSTRWPGRGTYSLFFTQNTQGPWAGEPDQSSLTPSSLKCMVTSPLKRNCEQHTNILLESTHVFINQSFPTPRRPEHRSVLC